MESMDSPDTKDPMKSMNAMYSMESINQDEHTPEAITKTRANKTNIETDKVGILSSQTAAGLVTKIDD